MTKYCSDVRCDPFVFACQYIINNMLPVPTDEKINVEVIRVSLFDALILIVPVFFIDREKQLTISLSLVGD